MTESAKVRFFSSPAAFRRWLEANHRKVQELWVGYYKRGTKKPSITWPESVGEALCFGWIDGVRKSIDGSSYKVRFSPRKPTSTWSAVNIRLARKLIEEGRMTPAGRSAFEARKEYRSGIYSYENRPGELPDPYAKKLKKNREAWKFFQSQPPSYRRMATWFVISAKRAETRLKRLDMVIENSARARRLR